MYIDAFIVIVIKYNYTIIYVQLYTAKYYIYLKLICELKDKI